MRKAIAELHSLIDTHAKVMLAPNDWASVPDSKLGDFAVPCFKLSKAIGKKPQEVSVHLAEKINAGSGYTFIKEVIATGPYLNVKLNFSNYSKMLLEDIKNDSLGKSKLGSNKKIIVEYSSPNVAKEMALHHLRTTCIGHSLARILDNHGYDVTRINYLGDWGTTHGKLLMALEMFGEEARLKSDGVSYMLELYVRFNKEEKSNPELSQKAKDAFQRLESGDQELKRRWQLFRDISIEEFKKLYKRLGVDFDHYDGESFYEGKIDAVVDEITQKIGTRVSEGALVCDLPNQKIPALLKKDDGASLYLTRDIAAAEDRQKRFGFDECWYVVASQQKFHFDQLFSIVKLLEKPFASGLKHIPFGMLSFGSKTMKSREGNVIFLNDVLDEARDKAKAIIQEKNPTLEHIDQTAEQIGIGAILFSDLSQFRIKDVNFSWESALSFEGDTAPFIQYTHARCCSLYDRVVEHSKQCKAGGDISELLENEHVQDLLRQWGIYEKYCDRALDAQDPSQIAHSMIDVAKSFNRLYHNVRFLDEKEKNKADLLIELTKGTKWVLARGLYLLGIEAPERM
ncbi:arginine--tRNA ligase [bacterium]|nr:arginine--tRNA ligase [bacterium]